MLINNEKLEGGWVDINNLGVFLHSKIVPESPEISVVDIDSISGRKILLDTDFTHRIIQIQLVVPKRTREELRDTLTNLTKLFKGRFSLIFKRDESQLYRDAVLSSKIDVDEVSFNTFILTLNITAYDPYRYGVNEKVIEINNVTNETSEIIHTDGNYKSKPVIILNGVADRVDITINEKTLSYVNLNPNETIIIDNETYTVVREIDGEQENALANWRNNFVELESGENEVLISGDNMDLDIIIRYRDTFL